MKENWIKRNKETIEFRWFIYNPLIILISLGSFLLISGFHRHLKFRNLYFYEGNTSFIGIVVSAIILGLFIYNSRDRLIVAFCFSGGYSIFCAILIPSVATPEFPEFFLFIIQIFITLLLFVAVFVGGLIHFIIKKLFLFIRQKTLSTKLPSAIEIDDERKDEVKFCVNCGGKYNLGAKFCVNCGGTL